MQKLLSVQGLFQLAAGPVTADVTCITRPVAEVMQIANLYTRVRTGGVVKHTPPPSTHGAGATP